MIKYTREEFPARFTVFEHKCEYCGTKFYSNRSKGRYDTGTCRTYANVKKRALMASGGKIKSKVVPSKPTVQVPDRTHTAFIAANSDGLKIAERDWDKYFPNIPWDDVWEGKINQGYSDKYSFEYVNESRATVYMPHGWHIYLRLL